MVLSIKNLELSMKLYYCDGEPVTDFTVEFLWTSHSLGTVSRIVTIKYSYYNNETKI